MAEFPENFSSIPIQHIGGVALANQTGKIFLENNGIGMS